MSDLVIDTRGLRKWFGPTLAVADLSLSVRAGEIFGFLGPNGAGKTTSIKMLLSLVHPDGGDGRVLGQPLGDRLTRARIGFLPEHFRFHDCLTARELLRFHGRLYGLSGSDLDMRIDRLLARVDLLEAADRPVRGYSKGMLQRTGLAQALLNDPVLVFLDEPTSGLDPLGRLLVRDIISELRDRGTTVFLNSHLLGEVEATCDRVPSSSREEPFTRWCSASRWTSSTSRCESVRSMHACSRGCQRLAVRSVNRALTSSECASSRRRLFRR